MAREIKYTYLAQEKATKTPTGQQFWELYEERYWVVHPDKGLAFYDPQGKGRKISPQCNSIRGIVERLLPEGHEVQYLARVWMPHDCRDYL